MKRCFLSLLLLALLLSLPLFLHLSPPPEDTLSALSPSAATERFVTRLQSGSLEGLTVVRKIYRLPEDLTVAPRPDPEGYGFTTDVKEVAEAVRLSSELLAGQSTVWTEDTPFDEEYGIRYYRDESILVIVWHEREGSMVRSFAEVKVADASQFRRKLAGDAYGSGSYKFPTELAEECNAVLGLSADFYRFQHYGIHVYQRKLYRFDEALDVCWVDGKGDLILTRCHTITTEEQARQFIEDNDILFSLSFGPIMILNHQNVTPRYYDQGQSTESLPRTSLGQLGERHYLAMTVKGSVSVHQAAEYMLEKGVERCYALDGGQSGTIAMQGLMLNPSMFGGYHNGQRIQSDIIYFASAIPEDG